MNNEAKNIIQKQVLEIDFREVSDNPFALQNEISNWSKEQLVKEIELCLNEIAPENKYMRIDKLSIEVNTKDYSNWKNGLAQQISKKIKEQIQLKIENLSFENIVQHAHEDFFEVLKFYFENAYLPWWSTIATKKDFEIKLYEWLQQDHEYTFKLLPLLKNKIARERVVYEFSHESFVLLIAEFTNYSIKEIEIILNDVSKITSDASPVFSAKKSEYNFKILLLENVSSSNNIKNVIAESIHMWLKQFESIQKISIQTFSNELKNELNKLTEKKQDSLFIKEKQGTTDIASAIKNEEVYEDGIYINNAGLILIANFLPSFFQRVSVLENSLIKDYAKAVCCINFLATGIEEMAEFELVFPKILCGLDPGFVINTNMMIDDVGKEEANNLLASVIEHWSILKDTSIQGLQQNFLQRNGKLSFKNNEWLLQVEQKSYDMLLENLPWNISMIKLPWMQHLLKTEWN